MRRTLGLCVLIVLIGDKIFAKVQISERNTKEKPFSFYFWAKVPSMIVKIIKKNA